ncbi:aminotransferase class V-fold PLP-dependent enzyme [Marinomonas balearica]|uniref:Selenocysteine lyase/cysteine desulfurase n=1 Tax=Marinomonas balearica TaxID=491947 RepID=A0A4R6MDP5_9GAMM|nr:aminotransferase class V-fold PLP-dependent enzyme [Marinomonas balearica]TDO99851.1 selenocysteine lyase/cysteine desulfurase [Marinomonas balearica]
MLEQASLIRKIQRSVSDSSPIISGPFGLRKLVYADYTASGRALDFIEDAIQDHVLPFYANTHTEANESGSQTTAFREEARDAIRTLTNASSEDLVIFCGSGATAAVNVLISQLNLKGLDQAGKDNTVIILGPYEHHSNELPWRSLGIQILQVPVNESGTPCMNSLEVFLKENQGKRIVASFSAASNVSGIRTNDVEVGSLLNRYGALSIWDYAAAAPYVNMDMNPSDETAHTQAAKSAMFFSMHKFVGGPGTPGVLVVKKSIIANHEPSVIGGGTVSFVTPQDHTFLPIGERREEGGTPDIVGSIRAGLVAKLKLAVGDEWIESREKELSGLILDRIGDHPNIEILGENQSNKLTITSYRVKANNGQYMHHGLIVALLNDLFGIQVRGGCSCAGPYGHYLLGLDASTSDEIRKELECGNKFIKPGWIRFNLNYFLPDAEADYILSAIIYTATHAEKLASYYRYDASQDRWCHIHHERNVSSLDQVFTDAVIKRPADACKDEALSEADQHAFDYYFNEANKLIDKLIGENEAVACIPKRFVTQ